MPDTENLYTGCPVQHARQFISGKWQMGILWNLRETSMRFSDIKNKLPGISDKILMQELAFFVEKNIITQNQLETPVLKTVYALSDMGKSLITVINSIVQWGYLHLQDEQVNKEMNLTPVAAIQAIESDMHNSGV